MQTPSLTDLSEGFTSLFSRLPVELLFSYSSRSSVTLGVTVLSRLSHVHLCDRKDCGPPGSSVHGVLQARTLEWVAKPSSRGSS